MASIILERTSEFVNRFRNFGVYFDDKKMGTVHNGETKKFELPDFYLNPVSFIEHK